MMMKQKNHNVIIKRNFTNMSIQGTFNTAWAQFSNLKVLDLSNNGIIGIIPPEISQKAWRELYVQIQL